jgi:uncharacterized protein
MQVLDEQCLQEMVHGGAVLGAGGGGSISAGLAAGRDALARGDPRLVPLSKLPTDTVVVTLSMVGSVAHMAGQTQPARHGAALQRLSSLENRPFGALIPSEVGPQAVTYGWRESAMTGIPLADAPCNGRAHPLGLMGSMGLHRHPRYLTSTVAVAEGRQSVTRIELVLRASAAKASTLVRQAAASSGLSLSVARNPLPSSYVAKHAALGGLTYAQQIGKLLLTERPNGVLRTLRKLSVLMHGRVVAEGRVCSSTLNDRGGFTIGSILLAEHSGRTWRVTVCNEYMALSYDRRLQAVFPDLIVLFYRENALPLASSEVEVGQFVVVFTVPRHRLKLGSTMQDKDLLRGAARLAAPLT